MIEANEFRMCYWPEVRPETREWGGWRKSKWWLYYHLDRSCFLHAVAAGLTKQMLDESLAVQCSFLAKRFKETIEVYRESVDTATERLKNEVRAACDRGLPD